MSCSKTLAAMILAIAGSVYAAEASQTSKNPEPVPESGIISVKVQNAAERPLDQRLEIEIPNLIVNGYFREGGNTLPPRGWNSMARNHMKQAGMVRDLFYLPGVDGQKTVALRQNGLVLIPGEKYRLSGYIREVISPDQCKDTSASPAMIIVKIRAYRFSNADIKPDWHYLK